MLNRQVMIALSLYLDFTVDEKIGLAYNLYDPDGRDGYILYNELMKIFKVLLLINTEFKCFIDVPTWRRTQKD